MTQFTKTAINRFLRMTKHPGVYGVISFEIFVGLVMGVS